MSDRAEELADEIERSIEFYDLAGVDEVANDLSPEDASIVVSALREAAAIRAENASLRAMLRKAGEALHGVIRVADRATVEFDAARSIASRIEEIIK